MCLAIPGKILNITTAEGLRTGRVDYGGTQKDVCLTYVPEAEVGDYVIVHVGVALSRLDEDEAQETLALIEAIARSAETELPGEGNGPDRA